MADETLNSIKESFREFCRGNVSEARESMATIWSDLEDGGGAYHRCVLAHFIADTQQEAADELTWDLKALDIADDALAERVDGAEADALRRFLPSLHMNVADGYRKLGDFEMARRHLEAGVQTSAALGVDAYGQTVRSELLRIEAQIADGDSGPPVIFDFD